MIRICRDEYEIAGYKQLLYFTAGQVEVPELHFNMELFNNARKAFSDKKNGLIHVVDEDGESLFYIKCIRDLVEIDNGIRIEVNVNFDGCNLMDERNLDMQLLESADQYVFYEVEEYTYALTEFIIQKYPDKKIYYLDKYAKYFWTLNEEVIILESLYDFLTKKENKTLFITSDYMRNSGIVPEKIMGIYNSINVMNSLCWARKVNNFGEKNKDKTILLIDINFGTGCGLSYIVNTACIYTEMARDRGWIPVINFSGESMYVDHKGDNMWEQYFNPVSDISVEDALQSQRVICLSTNNVDSQAMYVNPYFRELWMKHDNVVISLRPEIKKKFRKNMPQALKGKERVLGVLMRGTDTPGLIRDDKELEDILNNCATIMHSGNFDKVYLATEDKTYYDAFKSRFGNNLIAIEQKRVVADKNSYKLIGDMLDIPQNEHKSFGQKYLMITYCLGCCDAIIYNYTSGAYYLTQRWREKEPEFSEQIGRMNRKYDIDNLVECIKYIDENENIAVYGIGDVAEKMFQYFQPFISKIIFTDKKAFDKECTFHGCNVITPDEMINLYKQDRIGGILITSSCFADEIKQNLLNNHIKPEHIKVMSDQGGIY